MSEKLAYLAGLFDGEGCIGILKSKPKPSRREKNPTFRLRIMVGNADPRLVWAFKDFFGFGDVSHRIFSNPGRIGHVWRAQDLRAVEALRRVYPYLRGKKEIARYGILLHLIKGMRHWRENPSELLDLYEKIREKIMELNHREFQDGLR